MRSPHRIFSTFIGLLFIAGLFNLVSAAEPRVLNPESGPACVAQHMEVLAGLHPTAQATVNLLKEFADKYHLPIKYVEVGPPERRVKRLVVGLNFHDWNLMQEYMRWFHLEGAGSSELGGVLPLEYAYELAPDDPQGYVGTSVRPRPDQSSPVWMFGREDVPRTQWWDVSVMHPAAREAPIVGFGHLIGVTPDEQKNIWHFLYNPDQRAPCKSGNCVAWQSQIEFGRTAPDATDDDRQFLATKLGFSRTVEHKEMTRRMWNYANGHHGAIVAFLNGDPGVWEFEHNLEAHIPKEPKVPADRAIKGVNFAKNPEVDSAMSAIPDVPGGTHVFLPIGAGASPEGMEALGAMAGKLKDGMDVHVFVNGISSRVFNEGLDKSGDKLRIHALFLGGNLRKAYSEGRVHYVPGHLADFSRYARDPDNKDFHYDAIVVRVSPPDKNGHYSLGQNYDMIKAVIESNPGIKVIAEVNPGVPFTNGDNYLTDQQITAKFHSNTPLGGPASVATTPVETNIGNNLAKLIPDDATLQVGIGNVFGGLAEGLKAQNRQGIKIRSEMMGDDLAKVIDNGNAVSAQTGFGFGSGSFYHWLDHNPKVTLKPTEEINDPARIQAIDNYVAVNTAIQVDLFGQVNATMGPAERGRISSPGGQVEFMSGASRSKEGKAIIALRASAKEGTISTISLDLYPGPITTPGEYVTHVVTEYGIAELAGKSTRQRAINLINVAAPKFRKSLADQAVARKIIQPSDLSQIHFEE